MRTLLIPAGLTVALAACGSDNNSASGTTAAATTSPTTVAATTVAPTTTTAPSTTAAPTTEATDATDSTGPTSSVDDQPVSGEGVEIIVEVGVDDATTVGSRVEPVPLGSDVTLRLIDNSQAQDYHLHGYDIEQKVDKGVEAVMQFTADKAGQFEVESHLDDRLLVVLDVK
jgi:hypothetical protein